jgi:hypothetical protein
MKATPDLKLKDSGNNTKYIFYGSTALVGLHFLIVEVRQSHSHIPLGTTPRDIHAPAEIRTRNPSTREAANLLRRPHGHWDRSSY